MWWIKLCVYKTCGYILFRDVLRVVDIKPSKHVQRTRNEWQRDGRRWRLVLCSAALVVAKTRILHNSFLVLFSIIPYFIRTTLSPLLSLLCRSLFLWSFSVSWWIEHCALNSTDSMQPDSLAHNPTRKINPEREHEICPISESPSYMALQNTNLFSTLSYLPVSWFSKRN